MKIARHAAAAEYMIPYDTNVFAAIGTSIVTSLGMGDYS